MAEAQREVAERASRADLRRRKIIETARRLFTEHGFHATGVAQIARESGVVIAQMYRDFASKEDIVAALAEEDSLKYLRADALHRAIDSGDSTSALTWLLGLLEPEDEFEQRGLFAEIVAESTRNPRIATIFTSVQQDLRSNIMQALAQIAPQPELEQRRSLLASLLLTFSLGLVNHRFIAPDLEVKALVQAMKDIIRSEVKALAALGHEQAVEVTIAR